MKTRVAVIGSGFGLYGLLPAFQQLDACSVVGLCGKGSERLLNYCQKTSVPVFHDWRKMLEETRPDAIAIAVVPSQQYEIVKFALARGLSVLAEKPLSHTLDQAQELCERAQGSPVAHMVDFIFPEIPEWKKTKELLDQGEIGRVLQLNVNWSFLAYDLKHQIKSWKTNPAEGGGALAFYGSHLLYNLEFLLGKIQSLYGQLNYSARNPHAGETVVNLAIQFQNGATGNVVLNCASFGGNQHAWEFQGEKGHLVLENSTQSFSRGFTLARWNEAGEKEVAAVNQPSFDPALDERVYLVQSLAGRFLRWHRQEIDAVRPDFRDGLRVQKLIEHVRDSAHHGKKVTT